VLRLDTGTVTAGTLQLWSSHCRPTCISRSERSAMCQVTR